MEGASGKVEDGAKGEDGALLPLTLLWVVALAIPVSPVWVHVLPGGSSFMAAALQGKLARALATSPWMASSPAFWSHLLFLV